MSISRTFAIVGSLACGLLLLVSAGSALAAAYAVAYNPGPTTLVLPAPNYYQVAARLTNMGDNTDTYHLSVTKNVPDDWTVSVCYGGTCYTPDIVDFTVPEQGGLAPGDTLRVDLDVTTLFTEGPGTFTLHFTSENDPSIDKTTTYTVLPLSTDPVAFVFSSGANVIETTTMQVVSFRAALFNSGTQDDSYTLTVSRDIPTDWTSTICYGGICYAPTQTDYQVPVSGTVPSGGVMDFDLDFTALFTDGTGSMTMNFVSNTDGSVAGTYRFYVSTDGLVAVDDLTQKPLLSAVQASPNPFNPRTEIRFQVGGDHAVPARVAIYDLRGREVRSIDAGQVAPGSQSVSWDGRDASGEVMGAGVYVAKVDVAGQTSAVKMSLVK